MAPARSHSGSTASSSQPRTVTISKALSWLLRHGATKERVSISADGYVKLSDVLNWRKLKALNADLEEVVEVVKSNEKQRFGLRYDGVGKGENGEEDKSANGYDVKELIAGDESGKDDAGPSEQTPHALALLRLSTDPSPSAAHYSIRAVQGHSLKSIEATSLLTPITLENAPEICVHGTFFSTWPTILTTGGLKAMTRNHIHFATGPTVSDVLPHEGANGTGGDIHLKTAMAKSEVVSGMRGDAEVLIYINVKRSIADGKMQWYRSENGVLLTEGVLPPSEEPPTELEETALMLQEVPKVEKTSPPSPPQKKNRGSRANSAAYRQQQPRPQPKTVKMVSTEYWEIVIGIGVGVLWQRGKGVVKDVPAELLRGGGKGSKKAVKGHVRNKGKGSENPKPKMMVEWDDIDGYH
jgi:2'-phosphotransferase